MLSQAVIRRTLVTSCCLKAKPSTRKTRHPDWKRKKIIEFSRPEYTPVHPDTSLLWRDCPREAEMAELAEEEQPNAWEMLYVEELGSYLGKSKMIGVFHANSIEPRNRHKAWQHAKRAKMDLAFYNRVIAEKALSGTKYENLLHFWRSCPFMSEQFVVFSPEVDPGAVLRLEKKIPEMYLMAVVVENRMLKKKQVQQLAESGLTLESARAELAGILQSPASRLSGLLGNPAMKLSLSLQQYVKDNNSQ